MMQSQSPGTSLGAFLVGLFLLFGATIGLIFSGACFIESYMMIGMGAMMPFFDGVGFFVPSILIFILMNVSAAKRGLTKHFKWLFWYFLAVYILFPVIVFGWSIFVPKPTGYYGGRISEILIKIHGW